jgi:hypothetical protein
MYTCTERGYELTFRAPKDDAPPILDYDLPTFNHIILFAPDTKCENLNNAFRHLSA